MVAYYVSTCIHVCNASFHHRGINAFMYMYGAFIYSLFPTTDVRDKDNRTPLHCACEWGHKHVVQYLVEEAKCYVGEI